MKTLLVQLSDLHLHEMQNVNYETLDVKSFFSFLKSKDYNSFDSLTILFTGDMTQNGYESEFKNFENLIDNINRTLKKEYDLDCDWIVIPGNHDVNQNSNQLDFNLIIDYEKSNKSELDKLLDLEKEKMNKFFKFSSKVNSLSEPRQLINQINKNNISFLLINSAPFSALKKIDKEHHYIPDYEFENLNESLFNNSICFALIHHRPDWFNFSTAQQLDSLFNKYVSIIFFGHEHIEKVYCDKTNDNIYFFNSGCLKIKHSKLIGGANLFVLNSDKNIIEFRTSTFDLDSTYAHLSDKKTLNIFPKKVTGFSTEYKQKNLIELSENLKINIDDIFVMPFMLNLKDNDDDIDTFEDFVEHFNNNKKITIYGRPNSGKTIFLKHFANYLSEKTNAIFISFDDISSNFETTIENAFYSCYGQRKSFEELSSFPSVLIVDGLDQIESTSKRNKFIEFINDNFEFVVVSTSKKVSDLNNDILKTYSRLSVNGFSYKQRNEYIRKICKVNGVENEEDINLIVNATSIAFSSCSMLDLTSPGYILLLVNKIISEQLYRVQNVSDAFTLIFEHDINNKILKYGKRDNLEDYLNILANIAFKVIENSEITYFNLEFIKDSVTYCKNLYKNIKLSFDDLFQVFIESGIICKVGDDKFKFNHNSLLAYFASREICTRYKSGSDDVIKKIYENIEIGLNGDILLFVLHELKETRILFLIKNLLDNALSVYSEINLNSKNNPILKMVKNYVPETKEQAENRSEFIKRLDNSEKKHIKKIDEKEDKALKKNNEFDEFQKTIRRALKFIEILAKASAGFKTELVAVKREELMKCSISSLLKVFYALFDISEEEAKEFHDEFENYKISRADILRKKGFSENAISKLDDKLTFENYIYDIMTTNLLNDLTYIARVMTSKVSSSFIDNIYDESNSMSYNLFKLVAYEEHGDMKEKFINLVQNIFRDSSTDIGHKYLVKRIVRVFSITNYLDRSELARISNASSMNKQKLLLNQHKKQKKHE